MCIVHICSLLRASLIYANFSCQVLQSHALGSIMGCKQQLGALLVTVRRTSFLGARILERACVQ